MEDTEAKLAAAPDDSCCSLANAPVPAMGQKASEFFLAVTPVIVLDTTWKLPRAIEQRPARIEQALSPPSSQALLCTFLI